MRSRFLWASALALAAIFPLRPPVCLAETDRLAHLHGFDPYYVHRQFPRLETPQWIGEPDVEAVVILAIDDMREIATWENYMRPILDRLKQIDGRAPVSIMTVDVDPQDPHLQKWLDEGLSLETHTADHPCPLLKDGDFDKARDTYERCVDRMARIPNSKPVAFRMPCCDSLNTVSPRFFAEFFNRTTSEGNYLSIDSSVFVVLTSNDPAIPRGLVRHADGGERLRKYLPFPSFVNTIEDYPYPYTIGQLCWEFPCIVPSDWEAQNLHQPNNPQTVEDLKAALDAVVAKRGVFDFVFHPHGWIRSQQVVQLIDHAVEKHGSKVKFLNFREALERLNHNLLAGSPLRAADGGDNGVRLIDVNNDGYQDVIIGNDSQRLTRIWRADLSEWEETDFPVSLVDASRPAERRETGCRFGIVREDGHVSVLLSNEDTKGGWHFDGRRWAADSTLLTGLEIDGTPLRTARRGVDSGVRLADLNDDGRAKLLVGNPRQRAVFSYRASEGWRRASYNLPKEANFVDAEGRDRGLRLIDVDDDRQLDVLFSNERRYGLYLFADDQTGWSIEIINQSRRDGNRIPMIVRGETNNGAWFHSRHLWVQNEQTARLPDLVDRRSFNDLLGDSAPRPRSPKASLTTLRPRDGFQVELVAAEPQVVDPIDFDWGADGRLWVVEMGDYPLGADGEGAPGGRVRRLEDQDGDGFYEHATVFLDGLHFPTGVLAWRHGVLVTSAPDIFYAEDTDGDGVADRRETLFTGLSRGNPQHISNGLVRGLDHWIYCAAASNRGALHSVTTGETVDVAGRDYRIQPDHGWIEPLLGNTQFIRSRDQWGDWFGNQNTAPMYQFMLEDRYLARNPHLSAPGTTVSVSDQPGSARVFPLSRTMERFNDWHTANRFTSACNGMMYRDRLFGPFSNSTFVSEPVHNLVHREEWHRNDIAYESRRSGDEADSEFLASTDNWFRPTRLRTGPDGALWVADMYRAVIEHPEWIPAEMQARYDLRGGSDRGRIYRIFPVGARLRRIPDYSAMPTGDLVGQFDSPGGAVRDLVQQVLIERQDKSSIPRLKRLCAESEHATARLHAMYTLDALDALDVETLQPRLADEHPGVRRHAVRLSEPLLADHPQLAEALLPLVTDPDPLVCRQVAYSLGEWDDPRAGHALAKLAIGDADNTWIRTAVLSSVTRRFADVVNGLVETNKPVKPDKVPERPAADVVAQLLVFSIAMEQTASAEKIVEFVSLQSGTDASAWQFAVLAPWLDALDSASTSLRAMAANADPSMQHAIRALGPVFLAASRVAVDTKASVDNRRLAIELVGRGPNPSKDDVETLTSLLTPSNPRDVQQAAVRSLGRLPFEGIAQSLFARWIELGPDVRSELLDVTLQRQTWLPRLFDAIEQGSISAGDIDATRRQQLLAHPEDALRERAERLLAGTGPADRSEVLARYAVVADLEASVQRGQEVFNKRCAVCHRFNDQGFAIGPDLVALTDRSTTALLVAILDPNRAIEKKYIGYTVATEDGRIFTGLLGEESSNSITLRAQEGKSHTLLRREIDVIVSTGKSLMPEGLEKDLSPRDVADVMAYIRAGGPTPKELVGNQPQLVTADQLRRELFCMPHNAEVYGDTLHVDPTDAVVTDWRSENDHLVWSIEAPHEAVYLVILEWSTEASNGTNTLVAEVAEQRVVYDVEPTGGKHQYRRDVIGTVRLTPGEHRFGIRSSGPIDGSLMYLKSLTLRPTSP